MAKKKKPRKCRICRKSPVWRGGDVKNPGPYCKKCYHKHIWVNRPGARRGMDVTEAYLDAWCASLPEPPPDPEWIADWELEHVDPELDPVPYPDDHEWVEICRMLRGE